jgi:hypothetical protein
MRKKFKKKSFIRAHKIRMKKRRRNGLSNTLMKSFDNYRVLPSKNLSNSSKRRHNQTTRYNFTVDLSSISSSLKSSKNNEKTKEVSRVSKANN